LTRERSNNTSSNFQPSIPSSDFLTFEKEYWEIARDIHLFRYLIPANLSIEKAVFLDAFSKRQRYNPRFTYANFDFDIEKVKEKLDTLRYSLSNIDNPLTVYYESLLGEDAEFIEMMSDRASERFPTWLSSLYGYPTKDELHTCLSILNQMTPDDLTNEDREIPVKVMKEDVQQELNRLNIPDWEVVIENSSARLSVNPVVKRITLKQDALFHTSERKRLMLHEIGVHVARYVNGERQPYLLFAKGFPEYLMTEEGLALCAEKRNGLLSQISMTKYCCRFMAAYFCQKHDFYECFQKIAPFLDASDCFDIVARIKRGLLDTSSPGGFTKDQVYLKGLWEVDKLDLSQMKDLFVGKIGVDDLRIVKNMRLSQDITYPAWIENIDVS